MHFRHFGDRPMLFVDVFDVPPAAKIVDPGSSEIRSADLADFSDAQSLELARILRRNRAVRSVSVSGSGRKFFEEMKRQGGF